MADRDDSEPLGGWGLVPDPVVEAVQTLNRKTMRTVQHLDGLVWPKKPRDVQDLLRMSVSDAHKVARAGTDLRALLTAYSHRFHQPRPVMSDLARAQGATPQGIPRRYGQATVDALAALLSEEPDIEVILAGLPSLSLLDLTEFSGPVGQAAKAMRDEGVRPRSAARLRAEERARTSAERSKGLGDVLKPIRAQVDDTTVD